jgi:HEAT repeat protein
MARTLLLAALALPLPQEDVETRLKEFAEAMKAAKADPERLAAIQTLAQTRHLKAAQKLTQLLAGPYSETVKAGAADAVGKIGDPKAGPGLQALLGTFGGLLSSENPNRPGDQKVAEAIVRALGTIRDRSAVKQLTDLLISNNIPLMAEACRSLAKIRDPGCLPGLLKLHYAANSPEAGGAVNPRKPLAPETLAALRRITGQKHTTPDDWNKWYRTVGRTFVPPPEESLGGLPPEVQSFAVYSGKGELAALWRFDLVFVNPENYTKAELSRLRAVALGGDPQAAMDKGCAGFVVDPAEAAERRKKFPRALLVARGDPGAGAAHVNAVLVEGLDPRRNDAAALEPYKEARARHDTAVLAVFVLEKKDEPAAARFARDHGFLCYLAPIKDYSALPAP